MEGRKEKEMEGREEKEKMEGREEKMEGREGDGEKRGREGMKRGRMREVCRHDSTDISGELNIIHIQG
jgi:hypothetical protein